MDNLWDATRGSTPGRSVVDQAKRSVLPTRTGVMMACPSEFNPVPRLMEWPFESSRGWFLRQVRDGHLGPLWGLDRHPAKRSQSRVAARCDWFAG